VLEDMMRRIASPLLLVSAGPPEKPFGDAYDAAPEYMERVTRFFDGALGGG
jgi:hypothetical protein